MQIRNSAYNGRFVGHRRRLCSIVELNVLAPSRLTAAAHRDSHAGRGIRRPGRAWQDHLHVHHIRYASSEVFQVGPHQPARFQ